MSHKQTRCLLHVEVLLGFIV